VIHFILEVRELERDAHKQTSSSLRDMCVSPMSSSSSDMGTSFIVLFLPSTAVGYKQEIK